MVTCFVFLSVALQYAVCSSATPQALVLIKIGLLLDQNCHRHGRMAHHVETMSSQIIPLSNKTRINDNETA
jgi:hypothetical protein